MHVNVCAPACGGQRWMLGISTVAFYLIYLSISFSFLIVHVHAGGGSTWQTVEVRGQHSWSRFSLFAFTGVPRIEPRSPGLCGNHLFRWPSLPPCILRNSLSKKLGLAGLSILTGQQPPGIFCLNRNSSVLFCLDSSIMWRLGSWILDLGLCSGSV